MNSTARAVSAILVPFVKSICGGLDLKMTGIFALKSSACGLRQSTGVDAVHRGVPEVVTTTRKRESNLRILCKAQPCATVNPDDLRCHDTRRDRDTNG